METKYYFLIIDAVILLAALVLMFMFFKKKRHLMVYMIFLVLLAVTLVLDYYADPITLLIVNGIMFSVVVAMIVAYQADIKLFFQKISNRKMRDSFGDTYGSDEELQEATDHILAAVQSMAKKDIGALILLTPTSIEQNIMDTGIKLNALVSAPLLECIFNTKAPLHDGAVVIKGNKILATSCFLPLTGNVSVTKEVVTRHRAAIGITEESDVLAIVVSEETGIISIAKKGVLTRYMTIERLKEEIETVYGINVNNHNKKRLG